jgi:thioredoxin 1
MKTMYTESAPSRADVDALRGPALLEFGTNWCGHCRAAQGALAGAWAAHGHDALPHFKVEDGPGRALGRSFRVKLWPTLIFLRDGVEVARVVRPLEPADIAPAFALLAPPA